MAAPLKRKSLGGRDVTHPRDNSRHIDMNEAVQPTFQSTVQRILLGCIIGLIIGFPTGAVCFVVWAMLRDPLAFCFVGFGFMGVLYVPLIGGIVGCVFGCVVGGMIVALHTRLHRIK